MQIRKNAAKHQINIDTELQAIAVKAIHNKPINISSIHSAPHNPINEWKLNKLLSKIPKPQRSLSDLNSHNTKKGCQKTNKKGKALKEVIKTITSAS